MFGQDEDSWKAFASDYYGGLLRRRDPRDCDPLLLDVCGRDWSKVDIYHDISAPLVKTSYFAEVDYPLFGEKLLLLQRFTLAESPVSLRTLYRDRKDFRFWVLLTVILTFILTFLQTLFSAGQLWAALASR